MNPRYHIIRNFPKGTSIFKKLLRNLEFFLGTTTISFRKNWLKRGEYDASKNLLAKGDVVLAGTFRKFSHLFIKGKVTHALLHIGGEDLIHVIADGVEKMRYSNLFNFYDTLVVLRPKVEKNKKKKIIQKTISFAKAQLKKPYNFAFGNSKGHEKYFCTQLVNDCFHHAGFHTNLKDHRWGNKPLLPQSFLKSPSFDIIYRSRKIRVGL